MLLKGEALGEAPVKVRKRPQLTYQVDPIRESLKILGAKWSLIIIRDIAFLKLRRFGQIRRNNPGLGARVLSKRLKCLVADGVLVRRVKSGVVTYTLTNKGEDAVYVLLALLRYGIRHQMKRGENVDVKDVVKELRYQSPFFY